METILNKWNTTDFSNSNQLINSFFFKHKLICVSVQNERFPNDRFSRFYRVQICWDSRLISMSLITVAQSSCSELLLRAVVQKHFSVHHHISGQFLQATKFAKLNIFFKNSNTQPPVDSANAKKLVTIPC